MQEDNLLKTVIESHQVEVKDSDFRSAVNIMLYKLRSKVAENNQRIIIKMEATSFVLNSKEPVAVGGKLLSAFNKDKEKYLYKATITVEVKYLEMQ
ncbi:MAG: hypothetical protein LBH40_07345 [Alphaproteobacteria bacterium]|jgi:hypothetical protein|nr:hypothetical protein [Alphaproteobacteria bacterium]